MKSLVPWIFVSIFIHALIAVLFIKIVLNEPPASYFYFVSENDEPVLYLGKSKAPAIERQVKVEPEKIIETETPQEPPADVIELESPDTLLTMTESVSDSLQAITHSNLFFRDTVFLSRPEYDNINEVESFFTKDSLWKFKNPPGGNQNYDNVAHRIYRESSGHPQPTAPVTEILQKGANYLNEKLGNDKEDKPVRMDFLPDEKQLEALRIIWQYKRATDMDIYAGFDTSIKITAKDLNKLLENLAARGLLKRKIVSPRNEFTFFGMTDNGIEMSRKNRRNRVYEYEPLISKEEMIDYLNAVFYQVQNGQEEKLVAGPDSLLKSDNIQKLLSRIY